MQKQLKTNLNGYGKNSIMNTFDTFIMYFGTLYACYIVYVNTPFKKEIDDYFFSVVSHPICQTVLSCLNTLEEMTDFLLIDHAFDEEMQNEKKDKDNEDKKDEPKVELYENKYLERFKQFSNEYVFSLEEL